MEVRLYEDRSKIHEIQDCKSVMKSGWKLFDLIIGVEAGRRSSISFLNFFKKQ
jgi:hypothetical protein